MPNRSAKVNRTAFRPICELIPPHLDLVPIIAAGRIFDRGDIVKASVSEDYPQQG